MTPPRGEPRKDDQAAIELVRQLGTLLSEMNLSEVEVDVGGLRVRLTRSGSGSVPASGAASSVELPTSVVAGQPRAPGLIPIEAPMVGTFYRAPSPVAEPYVREGDLVKEGQILCIIEAMKLMNEIEAKVGGRIAKIFPENGQPVEYGQPLFLIDPGR